jgi:hypothetical protein
LVHLKPTSCTVPKAAFIILTYQLARTCTLGNHGS